MPAPDDTCPGAADYLAFARDGDPAMLDRALRACVDRAYTQARRSLGNAADADDATQETLLQLVRSARRFDGSVPFAAWLGRLVHTACLRVRRSDRRRRRREEASMSEPAPPAADADRGDEVRALVARLPAADRTAIELHYFAGLPQAEVAAAMATSENAVALRLSRARTRLRAMLAGDASLASVAALLAAQPAHQASAPVMTGIPQLTTAVASGATLPATTVPLSTLQKGLLLMSSHPLAAAGVLLAALAAALLPIALVAAEPHAAPTVAPAPPPAGSDAWRGRARALLPFIDPAAPVRMAVDGEHLRRIAVAAKPTSLLADPQAQEALAHVRAQFRLMHAGGSGVLDWPAILVAADGAVFGLGALPDAAPCLVAGLDEDGARQAQQVWEDASLQRQELQTAYPAAAAGAFHGLLVGERPRMMAARAGGRWALADPDLLAAGQRRSDGTIPPAGLWARVELGDLLARASVLDPSQDPLGLAAIFGAGWRTLRPVLECRADTADGVWQAETVLSGAPRLPLRRVDPGIAGCVPADAAASLLLGCDPAGMAAVLATALEPDQIAALQQLLAGAGIDTAALPGRLSGDAAVVVRHGVPLPGLDVVIGLRPGAAAALRAGLDALATRAGLTGEAATAPALAAWSGFCPIGALQMRLDADRVVLSTGSADALLAPPPRQVDAALAIAIDLPSLARTWLPQLLALVPAKPALFDRDSGLADLCFNLGSMPEAAFEPGHPSLEGIADLDRLADERRLRPVWRRFLGGAEAPMQRSVAVYATGRVSRPLVVLRTTDAWHVVGWNLASYEVIPDAAALARRLAGCRLRAGSPAEGLSPVAITAPATFDRRWLPPLPVILAHLPACRLRLQPTADGFRLSESGLPLAGPLLMLTATLPHADPDMIARARSAAVLRRDGPGLSQQHARAIAALRRAAQALAERDSRAPALPTLSAVLAAAGVAPAELASLFDGRAPDAARLDQLGYFHPSGWPHEHFSWIVPLPDGLFLERHWAIRGGCDITDRPRVPLRAPTRDEQAELSRRAAMMTTPATPPEPPQQVRIPSNF